MHGTLLWQQPRALSTLTPGTDQPAHQQARVTEAHPHLEGYPLRHRQTCLPKPHFFTGNLLYWQPSFLLPTFFTDDLLDWQRRNELSQLHSRNANTVHAPVTDSGRCGALQHQTSPRHHHSSHTKMAARCGGSTPQRQLPRTRTPTSRHNRPARCDCAAGVAALLRPHGRHRATARPAHAWKAPGRMPTK